MNDEARAIINHLRLEPLPHEGGHFVRSWTGPALPSGRRMGTAIYFLLTPDGFSALHRLETEEIWHFYAGDSVEHWQLDPITGQAHRTVIGPDLLAGHAVQHVVPAGWWQGARLAGSAKQGWALVGCTMAPGWDEREFILAERTGLTAQFPGFAKEIHLLTR